MNIMISFLSFVLNTISLVFFISIIAYLVIISKVLESFESYRQIKAIFRNVKTALDTFAGIKSSSDYGKSTSKVVLNSKRKSASVMCERMGKKYMLTLPYRSELATRLANYKMILIKEQNGQKTEYDVTLPPGILYSFSAEDLGGDKLILRSPDNVDKGFFSKNEVPSETLLREAFHMN